MEYTFLSAFTMLFLIVDPVGNIPSFIAVMKSVDPARTNRIILRECVFGFLILSLFAAFGRGFLDTLGLTQEALEIGGAIVLMIIALKMMFPSREGLYGDTGSREPFIFPLAVPMLAGPSAMAAVMILANSEPAGMLVWLGAIALTMAASAAILIPAERIQQLCGERVTSAFERLMGLILMVIGIQMLLTGIKSFVQTF